MSSYAVILEMRKKKIGFFMHFIHCILSLSTIVWALVWIGHYLYVDSHNKKLDEQIERVYRQEAGVE